MNLPTKLNNFQINKRSRIEIKSYNGIWLRVQDAFVDLLKQGEENILNTTFNLWDNLPNNISAGIYLVKDKSQRIIYIGESSDVRERILTHSGRTYFSALRRHIGTEILGFKLQEINKKKRYFSENEDKNITDYLRGCMAKIASVRFGRYELEEYLIKKHRPILNRKENKKE